VKAFFYKINIFLVLGPLILGYTEGWGVDWEYYGMNEEGSYFYDAESMKHLSQNIVRVFVQSVYTEKGVSHWVEGGGKEFDNLDFSLIWSEFNCAERSIRHLQIVFYSKNGKVFYPINNEGWHFFVPDSMSETLYDVVCK
jgi:hypothetical protein